MRSFIVLAQRGSSRGKERKIDYEEKRVWDGLKEKIVDCSMGWHRKASEQDAYRSKI